MSVFWNKVGRVIRARAEATVGHLVPLGPTLEAMALRPYELHLELTNLCNANCVFCPYQYQLRPTAFMPEDVFKKAVGDFVAAKGGSVGLTPIVGDALIHRDFVPWVRYMRTYPEIDRIFLTTNAILLDKHGVDAVLECKIDSINISTAGFEAEMYRRVYRSTAYERMRKNVLELVRRNRELGSPSVITIALRPDRPLDEVMQDPDFQPILEYEPLIDFTWSFSSAQGRITELPKNMKFRTVNSRPESCVNLFNGPMVLPDGTVLGCSCVGAMDAVQDLRIGHVMEKDLGEIWRDHGMRALRGSFGTPGLNKTCSDCGSYRNLDFYRTSGGRERARLNRERHSGLIVSNDAAAKRPFAGG